MRSRCCRSAVEALSQCGRGTPAVRSRYARGVVEVHFRYAHRCGSGSVRYFNFLLGGTVRIYTVLICVLYIVLMMYNVPLHVVYSPLLCCIDLLKVGSMPSANRGPSSSSMT